MPTYQITTADGTFEIDSPTELTDAQAYAAATQGSAPSPETVPRGPWGGNPLLPGGPSFSQMETPPSSPLEEFGPMAILEKIAPSTLAREGGMMGGGLLAGRAAQMLPNPYARAGLFLLGSVLGRMGGQAGVEAAQEVQGQGTPGATGRILGEAKPGILGGAAGLAVPAALSTMARPFTKATPAAAAATSEALAMGVSRTAAEATGNALTAGLEATAGRTLTGAPVVQRVAERENQELLRAAERYLARRLTPEEFGAATLDQTKRVDGLIRALGREKFEVFKSQSQGLEATLPARDLRDTATTLVQQLEGVLTDQPAKKKLQKIADQLANLGITQRPASRILAPAANPALAEPAIPAGTEQVPVLVGQLSNIYRDLTDITPAVTAAGTNFTKGQLRYLKWEVDNAIKQAIAGTPSEGLYQAAKQFWAKEVIPFRKRVGGKALLLSDKRAESEFLRAVMNPNRPEVTKEFIKQMGAFEPQAVADLQTAVLTRILDGGTARTARAAGPDLLNPNAILKEWNKLTPEIRQALFPAQRQSIEEFMHVLGQSRATKMLAGNPSESGRAVIQAWQLGAVMGGLGQIASGRTDPKDIAFGSMLGAGGAHGAAVLFKLLGPYALARALTSPMTAQYVARGGRMLPQSEEFARILGQLGYSVAKTEQPVPAKKRQPILFGPRDRP